MSHLAPVWCQAHRPAGGDGEPTLAARARRACYGVLRFVMESGAKGCEVIVTGKLRAARAKAMKFKDGYMISSGAPVHDFIDSAVRHVLLRQGCLGIKVKIMRPHDATGKTGPRLPLPDVVTIHEPKEDDSGDKFARDDAEAY